MADEPSIAVVIDITLPPIAPRIRTTKSMNESTPRARTNEGLDDVPGREPTPQVTKKEGPTNDEAKRHDQLDRAVCITSCRCMEI